VILLGAGDAKEEAAVFVVLLLDEGLIRCHC
jgi:hypothetical protein